MDLRAQREKENYDSQVLDREKYVSVLKHASAYYNAYMRSIIAEKIRGAEDKKVLEIGSQCWYDYIYENNIKPEKLTCINISKTELEKGEKLSEGTGLNIEFKEMDANRLEFDDETFDVVYGRAILHHLNYSQALAEIHRVLKKDGFILFKEPLGNNPVAKLVRLLTPFARTADEKPLEFEELNQIRALFETTFYYEQLFSVPLGVISRYVFKNPQNVFTKTGYNVDRFLDDHCPVLRPYFRHVLIWGKKC